jgi:glycosyltransferase involved in cell wall biosynthesis
VIRHLVQASYDAVLSQNFGVATLAANLAARRTRVETAALVCNPMEAIYRHREGADDPQAPFRRAELYSLIAVARANARLARKYLVLSSYLGEVLREYGTRAEIDVVPIYGVDTGAFRPPEEGRAAVKQALGLPTDGHLVFFSSRVAPEKDAATLLRAVRRLADEGRSLWLLHRSRGYQQLLDYAAGFGVADRLIATDMADPRHGLVRDYQASDLCVQASLAEGLGFSPLEALACGVPVVAADVGGLRETIVPGETGYRYTPGDDAGLAAQMARALDRPEEAAALAAAGRRMVVERYDSDVAFAAFARSMGFPRAAPPAPVRGG